VGITRSALANYETNRTTPKRSVLRQICQRLGVSENALVEGNAQDITDLLGALGHIPIKGIHRLAMICFPFPKREGWDGAV